MKKPSDIKDGTMDEESKAIEKKRTWELTELPDGKKAIGVKWIYKAKKNVKRDIECYKLDWLSEVTIKKLRSIMMRYTPLLLNLKLSD